MRSLPVRLREDAIADLEDVYDYLTDKGASAASAMGFLRRMREQCEKIGQAPEGYPSRPDLGQGIRIAPFERSAVIVYRFEGDIVEIVNIFYGGRDYVALMRG